MMATVHLEELSYKKGQVAYQFYHYLATYNDDGLAQTGRWKFPDFSPGNVPADGVYVFANSTETNYYAIVQSNQQQGPTNKFGWITIDPSLITG